MVGVDRLDQPRRAVDPREIRFHVLASGCLAPARPRLVGELPCHQRRIVAVEPAGYRVTPHHDCSDIVVEHPHRRGMAVEFGSHVGELGPRMGRIVHVHVAAAVGPVEVGHHASGPFPKVGQVDDRCHAAPSHFGERVVESAKQRLVEVAGAVAEGRTDRVFQRGEFGRTEDAHVVDPETSQSVKLAFQSIAVTDRRIGAEIGGVPHVRSCDSVREIPDPKAHAVPPHELGTVRERRRPR